MSQDRAKARKNNGTIVRSARKKAVKDEKVKKAKKLNTAKKNSSKKVKRA